MKEAAQKAMRVDVDNGCGFFVHCNKFPHHCVRISLPLRQMPCLGRGEISVHGTISDVYEQIRGIGE